MRNRRKATEMKKAFTLVELLTVLAIIVLLIGVGSIAIRAMENSAGLAGSYSLLDAILNCALSEAKGRQQYIGVRFQRTASQQQYAIRIMAIPDKYPNLENPFISFRAMPKKKPILIARTVGIMPLYFKEQSEIIDPNCRVTIVFSPQGRLVRKPIIVEEHAEMFNNDEGSYMSDNCFIIYNPKEHRESALLFDQLEPVYINAYMGTIIRP